MEAEYLAAGAAGMEICWMPILLKELGYTPSAPSKLFMYNQSAMSVANNPEHHGRMKHLDLCYYWLRDKVAEDRIQPLYLKTEDMPAYVLTKPLAKPQVKAPTVLYSLPYIYSTYSRYRYRPPSEFWGVQ
jgi:hypothetical protein